MVKMESRREMMLKVLMSVFAKSFTKFCYNLQIKIK